MKKTTTLAIIVVAILGLVFGLNKSASQSPSGISNTAMAEFGECVTNSGAVFYGAFWCPHCSDQKKLLGEAMESIEYVECSTPDGNSQTRECIDKAIKSYPTWIFGDGSFQTEVLGLSELASKTGCVAPNKSVN
jgi:glutaredoxin